MVLSVFQSGHPPPCPAEFNLADYVLSHRHIAPNKIALEVHGPQTVETWTYQTLSNAVFATATGFKGAGVSSGDRVLLQLGNSVDFPICFLALCAIGAWPMPCSDQLTTSEVQTLIANTTPTYSVGPVPWNGVGFIDIAQLQEWRDLAPSAPCMVDPNDPAYILFTSGTSGVQKAVVHAHRAVFARRMMWDGWYDLRDTDRVLHAGAFNWSYTLGTGLFDPWAKGATAIVTQDVPLTDLPKVISRSQASLFAASPGVFRKVAPDMQGVPHALRHGLCAGDVLTKRVEQDWERTTGTKIYTAFGMTECSTFLSSNPRGAVTGTPQSGRRVAIVKHDRPQPRNETGNIAIHRHEQGVMLGYLEHGTITPNLSGDWFVTSDMGKMDETGRIEFGGRSQNIMNAGGYRVSPLELETVIGAMTGVLDVAVTEIDIKQDVKVIACFYVADGAVAENDVGDYCRTHLARYKQPRIVQPVQSLPRTGNGKLDRHALPELWNPNDDQT